MTYNAEKYEAIELLYDPLLPRIKSILDIVRQFIIDRGLIITGGMAIDYALRLKGDYIYGDNDINSIIPDWDFYSPNHMVDAYDLAKQLFDAKFSLDNNDIDVYKIDAIRALHIQTIRVRIYSKVVADITYIAPEIFNKMPFLIVKGIKVIHPQWQLMNVHLSFMYPLKDPPREAIFHRLKKDMDRGNRLAKYYPLENTYSQVDKNLVKFSATFKNLNTKPIKPVLYGFAAYAAIYYMYKQILPNNIINIIPATITEEEFSSPFNYCEFIISDPDIIDDFMKDDNVDQYAQFIDYMMGYLDVNKDTHIYMLTNNIINISKLVINDTTFCIANAHSVLLYFLYKYNMAYINDNVQERELYGTYYTSTTTMVNNIYDHLVSNKHEFETHNLGVKTVPPIVRQLDNIILNSPFLLPKIIYGTRNVSESMELLMYDLLKKYSNITKETFDIEMHPVPPKIFLPTSEPVQFDKFDYNSSYYFNQLGQKIQKLILISDN